MKDYTGGAVRRPGTETKKTKVSVAAAMVKPKIR